jgi:hypothetical protein
MARDPEIPAAATLTYTLFRSVEPGRYRSTESIIYVECRGVFSDGRDHRQPEYEKR